MDEEELKAAIRRLMLDNLREGFSGLLGQSYCYIAPSPQRYPFQWFWDTCFHVVILTRLGEFELAKRNLRSLFAMQEANGFVGHMIFWKQVLPVRRSDVLQARPSWQALRPHMSALIQPPVAAMALHALYEASGDRVYLGEMYARVKRHHDWLARTRDFDGDGLLTIISPFESGMDWKPTYDEVLGWRSATPLGRLLTSGLYWKGVRVDLSNFLLRYHLDEIRKRHRFLVKDAGFNALYAVDLDCMEKLASVAGDDPAVYAERRRRVISGMLDRMYDADAAAFFDVREPGSHRIPVVTPTILFPLAIPGMDERIIEAVVRRHLVERPELDAPFPIASAGVKAPGFYAGESPFIWRGPTWAFNNWFLFHALKKRGYHSDARRLRQSLLSLIERSGFREYYDPVSGRGYGARNFTWSGLIVDMRE